MKSLRLRAHAKINLTLEVIGRRADGYHELRSVMALVSLADHVCVARARRWHGAVHPPLDVPADRELAQRAARELARLVGRADAAAIVIRKRVPVAAGLGGGSSDAGAALRALGRLWNVEAITLREAALAVGSDLPFFLNGAIAEVRGRGEDVRPLPGGPWAGVLVLPRCKIATAAAFARLPSAAWSDGARTEALARQLRAGNVDCARLRQLCGNVFDSLAEELCPELSAIRAASGVPLFVSGSGPSLFAPCEDRARALALARRLRRFGWKALQVTIALRPEIGDSKPT